MFCRSVLGAGGQPCWQSCDVPFVCLPLVGWWGGCCVGALAVGVLFGAGRGLGVWVFLGWAVGGGGVGGAGGGGLFSGGVVLDMNSIYRVSAPMRYTMLVLSLNSCWGLMED